VQDVGNVEVRVENARPAAHLTGSGLKEVVCRREAGVRVSAPSKEEK